MLEGERSMRVPVAAFEVCSTSFLDADGKPLGELPDFASDRDPMVGMYRMMAVSYTHLTLPTSDLV